MLGKQGNEVMCECDCICGNHGVFYGEFAILNEL